MLFHPNKCETIDTMVLNIHFSLFHFSVWTWWGSMGLGLSSHWPHLMQIVDELWSFIYTISSISFSFISIISHQVYIFLSHPLPHPLLYTEKEFCCSRTQGGLEQAHFYCPLVYYVIPGFLHVPHYWESEIILGKCNCNFRQVSVLGGHMLWRQSKSCFELVP